MFVPRTDTIDFSQFPCPHCGQLQNKDLQPGVRYKCRACRTWFRVPKVREAARQQLASAVAASQLAESTAGEADIEAMRVGAVAAALLDGLPKKQVLAALIEQRIHPFEADELLERAIPYVRQGARRSGIMFMGYGALMLLGAVAAVWIMPAMGGAIGHLIHVIAMGFALGIVLMLVGLVKYVTGWNLH